MRSFSEGGFTVRRSGGPFAMEVFCRENVRRFLDEKLPLKEDGQPWLCTRCHIVAVTADPAFRDARVQESMDNGLTYLRHMYPETQFEGHLVTLEELLGSLTKVEAPAPDEVVSLPNMRGVAWPYVRRTNLEQSLLEGIEEGHGLIYVKGYPGVGKTEAVTVVAAEYARREGVECKVLDLAELKDRP